jgi:nucleoside-diphosphate-sugar epimerase
MIITLLGGSGFIGRALGAALEKRGDTVRQLRAATWW